MSPTAPPARISTVSTESAMTKAASSDRVGNLEIKFEGHVKERGVTKYVIRVTGSHGSHVVHRRYNEFDELHEEMFGHSVQTTEAAAAAMPPKGFWKKHFSKEFRVSREHQLEGVATSAVQAAANMDIDHCPPVLRHFLGLDDAYLPTASARPSLAGTRGLESEPDVTKKEHESLTQKAEDMIHKVEDKVEHALETIEQSFSHHEKSEPAVTEKEHESLTQKAEDMIHKVEDKVDDARETTEQTASHHEKSETAVTQTDHENFMQKAEDMIHKVEEKVEQAGETIEQTFSHHEEEVAAADASVPCCNKGHTPSELEPEAVLKDSEGKPSMLERIESKLHEAFHKAEGSKDASSSAPSKPIHALPNIYRIQKVGKLTLQKGIYYREEKIEEDSIASKKGKLSKKLQEWDSYVVGVDEGDGFLRVDGLGYLPIMHQNLLSITLAQAPKPEAIYTLSHDYYECTNHSTSCMGICCRKSKNMDDRATGKGGKIAWGADVCGVDQGDDWLKVRDYFVPMKLDGAPVLIVKGLKRSTKTKGGCFAGCCR